MWQMKNITFQAGQRLAFIIVFGVGGGGGGGCPKGEGGVPTCRLSPIDLGLPAAACALAEWGLAQTQPSITATPSGWHHPWHYANKIICLPGRFWGELQWEEGWGEGSRGIPLFSQSASQECGIKFKTLIKTVMKARSWNSVTPGGVPTPTPPHLWLTQRQFWNQKCLLLPPVHHPLLVT